jgi:hypothetical protein
MRKGINKTRMRVVELNELDHHEENNYHQEGDDQNQEENNRAQGRGSLRRG